MNPAHEFPHRGSFVEWTTQILAKFMDDDEVLVISPGFNVQEFENVYTNGDRGEKDIIETIDDLMHSDHYNIKGIVMSRVFEHLSMRDVDWYIYNMFKILGPGGKLILAVPDMDYHFKWLQDELSSEKPDHFILHKIHTSLFNEGNNIKDYHKIWTNQQMMEYLLQREKLFKITALDRITIDTVTEVTLEITARRL